MYIKPLFYQYHVHNRPFPICPHSLFQDESKCQVFAIHIEIRTNYNDKNFALRLALKERLRGTRKWSIKYRKGVFQNKVSPLSLTCKLIP